MDSKSHLDRALFRLTPTRTRFDLVLFYKGKNEKLASGLFEPFISHLKVARDEIAKGGYSICLQPPVLNVPWFTKATLERFVRFVSTPAVLERFVSLEKEILQIEKSVQDNEASKTNLVGKQEEVHEPVGNNLTRKSSDSSELKAELRRKDAALPEENSKIQLQRLLETRKTLLRKEQAMAYARGLVAGFAMETMDDLICFAEAFGASRLREACGNFIELCKKKHADQLWIQELEAVKACSPAEFSVLGTSGIVLTNESSPNPETNESPESKKDQQKQPTMAGYPMHMQWPNQMPPYMYNYPGYAQQLPPYQGYPYPPMQPGPHYPRNGHQSLARKQKSSSRKKDEEDEYSEEEGQTESSGSDSGSDVGSRTHRQDRNHSSPDRSSRRKHKKKSSRTIVIRNINYITPKKRDGEKGQESDGSSLDEDEFSGKDSLLNSSNGKSGGAVSANGSEKISDDNLEAVVSKERKTNDNWEAFQSILTSENVSTKWVETDGPAPALDLESEKVLKQRMVAADSFIVKGRDEKTEGGMKFDGFVNEESFGPLRKSSNSAEEVLFNSRRLEGSGNGFGDVLTMSAEESSVIKSGKGEDWFVANHSGKPGNQNSTNGPIAFDGDQVLSFDGDYSYSQKSKRESFVDDSIMVQARPELDGSYDSQWKTEISIMEDITSASKQENDTADHKDQKKVFDSHEPDDLFMVIGRDEGLESARDSMNFDYEIDLPVTEANTKCSDVDAEKKPQDGEITPVKTKDNSGTKKPVSKVLRGSLANSRAPTMSRSQKTSPLVSKAKVHKSKFEQEEEMRKKMEELAIERQKRISERTAATKKPIPESKTTKNSVKLDRSKTLPAARAPGRVSAVKF